MTAAQYAGLDLLATAVVVLDEAMRVHYANAAAEQLLQTSRRSLEGAAFGDLFLDAGPLVEKLEQAITQHWGFWDQAVTLTRPGQDSLQLNVLATPVDQPVHGVLLELRAIDQHLRIEREEQLLHQQQANRELIRNLAHEIKNPLGGLRGSAQLLESELDRPELREYTQVIIKEADRLQGLMDRLLTPHRPPHMGPVNIHEVLERVRSLILAEFPNGIRLRRDYDTSLPEIHGDREQLIQVLLNIVRNAAQALQGQPDAEICLRTRVARAVTIARRRYRLALDVQIIDNGPGIPPELRDRIFYPLVSGREGGHGLGLTLAQTYVQHHQGMLECESEPGRTVFRIILPIEATKAES
ncbi:MAG: nitrogen regulation protein NR(II) [Burkholderiales bacterium]|nr:nitrogen regulation protein NR(II) [Burkholderiales bacterium]